MEEALNLSSDRLLDDDDDDDTNIRSCCRGHIQILVVFKVSLLAVISRTWCRCRHTHGISVADGTHQTSAYSSLTFKHLPHRGIPEWKKSVSNVCSQEVTACFTSASVANRLQANWLRTKMFTCLAPGRRGG